MICYLCGTPIPDDQSFFSGHDRFVCQPCFKDASRCFLCRFPSNSLQPVEGLGLECEFCRGQVVTEGDDLGAIIDPVAPFLVPFGLAEGSALGFKWIPLKELRVMQTDADLPSDNFIDDFLRFCYPVYYREGSFYCLRRMAKSTFIVYGLVQLAAGRVAEKFGLPDLRGDSPFQTFARGYCHYIGYEAAQRLNYDLEQRQLRKWPEMGGQGEFERWQSMAKFEKPAEMAAFFRANLGVLARKHLEKKPGAPETQP